MPTYDVLVTMGWTHRIHDVQSADEAWELVACNILPDLTLENSDGGTFFIDEPVEVKEGENVSG